MQKLAALTLAVVSVLMTGSASAQSPPPPLSELLPQLHRQVIAAEDFALFSLSYNSGEATRKARLDTVLHTNNLLADQLSSFPLGSSAGGFTWTFEPASATFSRGSDSFGPIFAERAITIGRNRLNIGFNYQRVTFDHLDGKDLRNGEVVGYTGIPNYAGINGVFFAEALTLQLTTDTVSVFGTYGVNDRLDIGVVVPINRVDMKASFVSQYGTTITGTSDPSHPEATDGCVDAIPWFQRVTDELLEQPSAVRAQGCGLRAEASGSAAGIGDVVVRAKYQLWKRRGGGIASGADVRLPTGDERNLLGIAGAQAKLYLAASSGMGRFSPHVNLGYTVSGASDAAREVDAILIAPPDELNYAGGADVALSLRTTVAFDVVGRTLRGIGTLDDVASGFGSRNGDFFGTLRPFNEFRLNPGDLNLLLGSAGIKFNPAANLLMSVNVLFPLSRRGLTDTLTWHVGFDYSF